MRGYAFGHKKPIPIWLPPISDEERLMKTDPPMGVVELQAGFIDGPSGE